MNQETPAFPIEKIDKALSILNEELKTASIEDLVKEAIIVGNIEEMIDSVSKKLKNLPNYLETKTRINVIKESYLTEAQRRDRES